MSSLHETYVEDVHVCECVGVCIHVCACVCVCMSVCVCVFIHVYGCVVYAMDLEILRVLLRRDVHPEVVVERLDERLRVDRRVAPVQPAVGAHRQSMGATGFTIADYTGCTVIIRNYKRVAWAVGAHRQSTGATGFTIADYTGCTVIIRNCKCVAWAVGAHR